MSHQIKLTEFLEQLNDKTAGDVITLGEIVNAFKQRGFGPLLLAPALLVLLPFGAIPGIPTVCGLFIFLIGGQLLIGRDHPWLPPRLRNVSFNRDKFKSGLSKVVPFTKRIDSVIGSRLTQFIEPPVSTIVGVLCIILALTMIPLELLPFAAAAPAWAIAFFALGLTANDGLLVIIGLIVTVVGGAAIFFGGF
jgi:hypothetical protein